LTDAGTITCSRELEKAEILLGAYSKDGGLLVRLNVEDFSSAILALEAQVTCLSELNYNQQVLVGGKSGTISLVSAKK
jgi:hypothetical protein